MTAEYLVRLTLHPSGEAELAKAADSRSEALGEQLGVELWKAAGGHPNRLHEFIVTRVDVIERRTS